jgi:hypothetical protein
VELAAGYIVLKERSFMMAIANIDQPICSTTADTGPHGEVRPGRQRRAAKKVGALVDRDYGELDLKAEALVPGDMVQGSDGNPVTGTP